MVPRLFVVLRGVYSYDLSNVLAECDVHMYSNVVCMKSSIV